MKIFEKTYNGETILGVSRDIEKLFENEVVMEYIPNEDGIPKGKFTISVVWENDED